MNPTNPNKTHIPIDQWAEANRLVNEHSFESLHEFNMGGIGNEKLRKNPKEKFKEIRKSWKSYVHN